MSGKKPQINLGDKVSVDQGYGQPLVGIVFTITPMGEGEDAYESYNIGTSTGMTYSRSSNNPITVLERATYTYAPRGHLKRGDLVELSLGKRAVIVQDGASEIGSCLVCTDSCRAPFWVKEQELVLIHAAGHPVDPPTEMDLALSAIPVAEDLEWEYLSEVHAPTAREDDEEEVNF